jgi:murein L,D-transpeptidase YcbB/YkuD
MMLVIFSVTARSQQDTVVKHLPEFALMLQTAQQYGLNKDHYDFDFIMQLVNGKKAIDSTDTARISARVLAAMEKYVTDVISGRPPKLSYDALTRQKNDTPVSTMLNEALSGSGLQDLIDKNEIRHPAYDSLKAAAVSLSDSLSLKPAFFARRLKGVQQALQTFRWMHSWLKENEYTIVVNIPSATLLLFRYGTPVLESKVIVGKRSTRTPTMASMLSDITIYPYWNVPKSIATKELLPEIKKDIGYLDRNNFQVLNDKGFLVSAYAVPWHRLSTSYFPYTIRQSTGCDNSLGLIKLNINNPFNVYLHDTPWKVLFESTNRFFSHGCVRVQKAKELSHFLLNDNSMAVDTLDEKASLAGHKPTIIALNKRIPVFILYNTAWFDIKGVVRFSPDIYSKMSE